MSFNLFKPFVFTLLLGNGVAMAIPFNSFDARSMAMGGTGVAVADAASAPLFNPALLSITRYSDDFSLVIPTLGVHVADPEDLIGSVDKFESGNYVDNLQTAVTALNSAVAAVDIAAVQTNAAAVSTRINTLSTQLDTLNNKPITLDAGVATVVGIPNKKFGIAFYANGSVTSGGIFQYKDAALLATLSAQATCFSTAAAIADPAAAAAAIALCETPAFTTDSLKSAITMRGVMLAETGFAISREFRIYRRNIAFGITPKIIQAQLYDVPIGLNSPSLSNFNGNDYRAQYSMLNFDFGMAQNFRNGWRTGLAIKNVIPAFLDFKRAPVAGDTPIATGDTLRLIPQTRAGISYTNRWSTVAMDVDLYRNDPAGLENYTQYVALGGEINGWNWGQLRAGYRADLVDSARNIISLGLGFSPFGVHADLAVAGNEHELGASFRLGFHF